MRARNWCFTRHWPDTDEGLALLDPTHWEHATFLTYQLEISPTTNKLHYQGYLELDSLQRLSHVQKFEGLEGAHFEPRRGSQQEAIDYVHKEESKVDGPWSCGEPKNQGERTDLASVRKRLRQGATQLEIADEFFGQWVRYNKAFSTYSRLIAKPRDFKSIVILVVGPAGVGKSRFAHSLVKYLGPHYKLPDKHTGFWCDDYSQQPVFFIDEMDGDRMRPKTFNELCDRYECILPAHGGVGHQFTSRYVVIVSNYLPKYWWRKRNAEQVRQTTRRIDIVFPFFRPPVGQLQCHCPNMCVVHHP